MTDLSATSFRPCEPLPLSAMAPRSVEELRAEVLRAVAAGRALVALFCAREAGANRLWAVLADRSSGTLAVVTAPVGGSYPALTPDCPQASHFEREIAERWEIDAIGHPWLKPVRGPAEQCTFFRVEGDAVHEVAVGPVHAGVIEPGHFRFQCNGEHVFHLEIALGYQHRGVERALVGGPGKRTIHFMETLAGDTSIGHATAYSTVVEALAGCAISRRAAALRELALELERLANHAGDLGALAGDVGFLPTASYCGRIRGDFLNLTALVCGSRFGRGLVRPGGVAFDLDAARLAQLRAGLDAAMRDAAGAVRLLWETSSVRARFEHTGVLDVETVRSLGIVGPPARAAGHAIDARHDFPLGQRREPTFRPAVCAEGDVYARAQVRWLEMEAAAHWVRRRLDVLAGAADTTAGITESPTGNGRTLRVRIEELAPRALSVACVEGWRGEIWHVALTDAQGRFAAYKVFDPSFRNWMGLAMAMRDQEISDFPLCNKSFNLSYCGHDL